MADEPDEEEELRQVTLQNARSIFLARQRVERELEGALEALELKTKELAEQQEWFRVTLASIGDAVITTDMEARVTYLNATAEAMTGWTCDEARNQPLESVFRIIHETTRETVASPLAEALRTGGVVGLANHTVLIARDGSETPVEDSAAPIRDAAGKVVGAVMVFHDVTARRKVEEERERLLALEQAARGSAEVTSAENARLNEELRRANAAKDRFLAVLSHELRTPLNPVLMTVVDLESDMTVSEDVRKRMTLVRRNVELEARLIDDLLDSTRITSGKLRLVRSIVDARELLPRTVGIVEGDATAKGVRLDVLSSEEPCPVDGDPGRLQQILWNLVKNAVKFTPKGGHVWVSCGLTPDGKVQLQVKDNGIGIAPQDLERIFNAFEQGDSLTAQRYGGLGLGLAISKALVTLHDGSLSAESEGLGRGATFTIELPLATEAPAAAPLNQS